MAEEPKGDVDIFRLMDQNKDGRLFITELAGFNLALVSIRLGAAVETASKEFASAVGSSNVLAYESALHAAGRRRSEVEREAFDAADTNHDGFLSLDEYGAYHSPATSHVIREAHAARFLSEHDSNSDGVMSLWEFLDHELLVKGEGENRYYIYVYIYPTA